MSASATPRFGRLLVGLLGVVLLLAGAACGSSSSGSSDSGGSAVHGGTLRIAQVRDPESMDPTATYANESILVLKNLYEMLYDSTPSGQGFVPMLATGYTLSSDKLAWTFHLRPGVDFANGKPMTSADVKFSFERADAKQSVWAFIDDAISSITTPDPETVVFHTKVPTADMLAIVSLYGNSVIPDNYGGKTEKQFFAHPIGTGPFEFHSWTRGQSLTATRNTHYWQKGKPYLDKVVWSVVPDNNTRFLQLQGSQIDVDEFPAFSQLEQIASSPNIKLISVPSTRIDMILFNQKVKPFQDIHVRKAINFAINRKALVQAALFGHGTPAGSFLAPNIPLATPVPAPNYSMDAAKAEMAKSTVPSGFSTTLNISAGSATDEVIGEVVQQELKPLGINVTIQKLDPSTWFGNIVAYKYDMSTVYFNTDIADSSELVQQVAGTNGIWTGYNNAAMNALANGGARPFNPATRKTMYAKFVNAFAASYATAPLFQSPWVYAVSNKVRNFNVLLTGNYHLSDIWLSK
jgi:peptide/nickel transport system substrate-binding protein